MNLSQKYDDSVSAGKKKFCFPRAIFAGKMWCRFEDGGVGGWPLLKRVSVILQHCLSTWPHTWPESVQCVVLHQEFSSGVAWALLGVGGWWGVVGGGTSWIMWHKYMRPSAESWEEEPLLWFAFRNTSWECWASRRTFLICVSCHRWPSGKDFLIELKGIKRFTGAEQEVWDTQWIMVQFFSLFVMKQQKWWSLKETYNLRKWVRWMWIKEYAVAKSRQYESACQ